MTTDSPETCYGCEMPMANCNCRFAGLGEDAPKADGLGLAPCPFCGGAADIDHDHTVEESHAYGCRSCGVWFNDYLADDPIAAWNRRPDRSPAGEVRFRDTLTPEQLTIHDALCDSSYIAGAKAGWRCGIMKDDDEAQRAFDALLSSRDGHLEGYRDAVAALSPAPAPERERLLVEALRAATEELHLASLHLSYAGKAKDAKQAQNAASTARAAYEESRK